jgi:NADPH:quinone reductase
MAPIGGAIFLEAFRSIVWNGRPLVIGFAAGSIPALPFNLPLLKGATLLGVDLAHVPRREPEVYQRISTSLFRLLSEKRSKPAVDNVSSSRISMTSSRRSRAVEPWAKWS